MFDMHDVLKVMIGRFSSRWSKCTLEVYLGAGCPEHKLTKSKVLVKDHAIWELKDTKCIDLINPTAKRLENSWLALKLGQIS